MCLKYTNAKKAPKEPAEMFHKHINRRRAISVDGLDPTKLPQSWGGHNDNNNNTNNITIMMTMIKMIMRKEKRKKRVCFRKKSEIRGMGVQLFPKLSLNACLLP